MYEVIFSFDIQMKTSIFLSVKNRHHTALFIQNGYLKLLIRQGPMLSTDNAIYASEWMWKVGEINDDQWHSYKIFVDYPNKVRERIFSCYSSSASLH
jgi:hypothetical protein